MGRRRGFTLTELAVVAGSVTFLAGLLMVAVEGARESEAAISCVDRAGRLGLAVGLFEIDFNGDIPKNRYGGVAGSVDGSAEGPDTPIGRQWRGALGWQDPGPLPGEYSHMGHWQNQVYQYVPEPSAFACETWANAEDWTMPCDRPDVVAGPPWNGHYYMKDNWVPGHPWLPDSDDCLGVHSSDQQTSVIADIVPGHKRRVGELAVPEATYLYTEVWCSNGYYNSGRTLAPFQWAGFHNMSRATLYTFQSDAFGHYGTQTLGDRMMIFGDGHAEMMTWQEMRCRADRSDPTSGWVIKSVFQNPSCRKFQHISAQPKSRRASWISGRLS